MRWNPDPNPQRNPIPNPNRNPIPDPNLEPDPILDYKLHYHTPDSSRYVLRRLEDTTYELSLFPPKGPAAATPAAAAAATPAAAAAPPPADPPKNSLTLD